CSTTRAFRTRRPHTENDDRRHVVGRSYSGSDHVRHGRPTRFGPMRRESERLMADALEQRYEDELNYVRRLANEFARHRPKIADRLLLDRETGASEDPHVERLIEAFAFLTAR